MNIIYKCPRWVIALLEDIESEIARIYWNKNQKEWTSAFRNTGDEYIGKCFEVHAYSWADEPDYDFNFKCGDIEISWYKHVSRGTMINISPNEAGFKERIIKMYERVIAELDSQEVDL